jgi:hypothetical protein
MTYGFASMLCRMQDTYKPCFLSILLVCFFVAPLSVMFSHYVTVSYSLIIFLSFETKNSYIRMIEKLLANIPYTEVRKFSRNF